MKRNLLATTALVAAGVLASQGALAEAKPIEIKLGGFYEQWVGFVAQDADADNGGGPERYADDLDVQEDAEIHFEGSTTTDNGLTFGINVQLEAATSGDQIDESYLFMRGDFGELLLGSENGAEYAMHYGADNDMGIGLEDGDNGYYWMSESISTALHSSRIVSIDNDSNKIRWISPRFSGFQIGLGYAPEGRQDDDGPIPSERKNAGRNGASTTVDLLDTNGNVIGTQIVREQDAVDPVYEQIMSGAINYRQTFDGVEVGLSAAGIYVGDVNNAGSSFNSGDQVWGTSLGLRVGANGFLATLGWNHQENHGVQVRASANVEDADVIAAGLSYEDGPMGVSLTGAYGWTNANGPNADDNEITQIVVQLGGKYALGPGIEARGAATYGNSENLTGPNQDYEAFSVVGGIALRF